MTPSDYALEIHSTAQLKGWYDTPREDGTFLMLMVSELSEALEEFRNNKPDLYLVHKETKKVFTLDDISMEKMFEFASTGEYKPEGASVEVVDCIVRAMDYFAYKGWNLNNVLDLKLSYNNKREYRHGNKAF
jgi:hypothetical protein